MTWAEAARLGRELEKTWGTHVQAAVNGWKWPWGHVENLAALQLEAWAGEPGLYPRPWDMDHDEITAHNEAVFEALRKHRATPEDSGHMREITAKEINEND